MKKVLLIGDVMLDINTHGTCTRISPEAPVQVVKKTSEIKTLGGAGNNLTNLSHLNIPVDFISVIGNDEHGINVDALVAKHSKASLLIREHGRVTTVKNRILASKHQVLRIDEEDTHDITKESETQILNYIRSNIENYSIIMVSDYSKGVCTENLFKSIISIANEHNVKIICDPKKHRIDFYKGCYIITPNRSEAEHLVGFKIKSEQDVLHALKKLAEFIEVPVITLSEEGIAYLDRGQIHKLHAKARDVIDVTGAGDTVVSTICYGVYKNLNLHQSIELANKAASIVVSRLGTSYVTEEEILTDKKDGLLQSGMEVPRNKGKIVFTNGCFDVLHAGHVEYLKEAKKLGDILVIGLNSDDSVRKLKGETRPINKLQDRADLLLALKFVDYVIPFSQETPYRLIKEVQPDILVKGGDYKIEDIVGNDIAKKTIVLPFKEGFSSTTIIQKAGL